MGFQDCLSEVSKAVGRELSDTEYEEVFDAVQKIIDQRTAEGRMDKIDADLAEQNRKMKIAAYVEKRNAALNKLAVFENIDFIFTTFPDRPELGFKAILDGTQIGARKGSRNSVGATQGSLFASNAMGLIADMEEKGIFELFSSGEIDADIYKAIHELDKPEPDTSNITEQAVEAAKIIQKYNENMRVMANKYGANISKLSGYLVKQTHDAARIYKDRDGWLQFMQDNLDPDRTFPDVTDPKERKAIIDRLYDKLSTGLHLSTSKDGPPSGFKGFANIGKKMSQERVLHFKDATAEYNYAQTYGAGKLTEGVVYGIEKMAQDIGIMMRLGPNADMNLPNIKEQILRRMDTQGDSRNLKKVNDAIEGYMRRLWPQINGLARVAGNHMLADISQTVRATQMWSKLGGAMLSGIADVTFSASEVKYQGGTMLGGLGESLQSLASNVPKKDRARLMSALGVVHDGMLSATTKRFDASDTTAGTTSAITNIFFKMTGLRWWTDQLRTGFARARSHDLALQSDKPWSDIGEDLQRVLGLYGVDEDQWKILQKAVELGDDGRQYMTPESVNQLPNEAFTDYAKAQGWKTTPRNLSRARDKIVAGFRSYFYDRSTMAVIEPDATTRSYLHGGTRAGTVEGELLRHLTLFKSFTASVIQKPLAREIYGKGAMSIREMGSSEMLGLANLIVWNIAFGYLAMTTKDLAKGRTPRDPSDYKTFLAAAAQGGGFGIYGDFLFGDMKNRYGGGAISTLAGPTAGTVEDIVDIFQRLRDGDDAAAQTFRTALNNTPFINIFYTKWALDYLILNQISEHLSPGYLKRMERRLKEENDQTLLLPQTL